MHKIQPLFQLDSCIVMIEEWLCIYATSTKIFMTWSIHDYIFECLVTVHAFVVISPLTRTGTLSGCQTAWMQIRTDVLSGLIWIQAVCKGYQHAKKILKLCS